MAAKSKGNKKKGPKGKRARAKAKLERQWGEIADEPVAVRKSKSRLLPALARNDDDDDDRSDEDLLDGTETKNEDTTRFNTGRFHPYKSLMSQIQGASSSTMMVDEAQEQPGTSQFRHGEDNNLEEEFYSDDGDDDVETGQYAPLQHHTNDLYTKRFINGDQYRPIGANRQDGVEGSSSWKKISLSDSWEMQVSSQALSTILPKKLTRYAKLYLTREEEELDSPTIAQPLLNEEPLTRVAAATLNVSSLYADLLVTDGLNPTIRDQIQASMIRHILAHVYRYRSAVAETEARMKKDEAEGAGGGERRDQGFVRPTVLVLLPTRNCCFQFIQRLTKQSKKTDIWRRFEDEYGPTTPDEEGTEVNQYRQRVLEEKSKDWKDLFSDEKNSDDDFKIGVQWNITKNRFRLYTDFLKSDFIVASPLGLKILKDFDCLSSIEICIVDRADVLAQQNWDHVNDVLEKLNQQPKSTNETDFSRVRDYFLSGKPKMWRQTIFSTGFLCPEVLSSFRQFCSSQDGHVKIRKRFTEPQPIDSRIETQVFTRVPCKSFAEAGSSIVNFFFAKVFETLEEQTLVFIPSYFDYVMIRNTLIRQEFDDFVSITEYSQLSEVARGRARFRQRQRKLLLYTGRAHFFMRHAIKGARNIVFVGVPEYPTFYVDLVERLEPAHDVDERTCQLLFTKFDGLALERIVGSTNCNRMIKGDKTIYTLR